MSADLCAQLEKVDALNLQSEVWRCAMERVPRQKYTKEFREQAVQLVQKQERTIPEAARRLATSNKTLANWVFLARRASS